MTKSFHSWPLSAARHLLVTATLATGLAQLAHAQLSVTNGGGASYSHPINVPPGRGAEPTISIDYTGGRGGPVGQGWALTASSMITRCAPIKAIDGQSGAVNFYSTDKLCLNGARLIAVNSAQAPVVGVGGTNAAGVSGTAYREFRLETDSKVRVRAFGQFGSTGASGPAFFKVWKADGSVSTYGKEAGRTELNNAVVVGSLVQYAGTAMTWMLAEVADSNGNLVSFYYDTKAYAYGSSRYVATDLDRMDQLAPNPKDGLDTVLAEVRYGPGNKLVFSYSDRSSSSGAIEETVFRGNKTVSVRKLDSITSYINANGSTVGDVAGATPTTTTKLSYTYGPKSGRLLLAQISECAGGVSSARCKPAKSFEYYAGASSSFTSTVPVGLPPATALAKNSISADLDGDGRTDVLVFTSGNQAAKIYRSLGGGNFALWQSIEVVPGDFTASCPVNWLDTIVRDFNGDGRPDIFRFVNKWHQVGADDVPCEGVPSVLYLNTGSGFQRKVVTGLLEELRAWLPAHPDPELPSSGPNAEWDVGISHTLIDVNGDGNLDVLVSRIEPRSSHQTPGFDCPGGECTQLFIGDGMGGFVKQATNISGVPMVTEGEGLFGGGLPVLDLNGDGFPDLLFGGGWSTGVGHSEYLSNGDGTFSVVPTHISRHASNGIPLDLQGDGIVDIGVPGSGVATGNGYLHRDPLGATLGRWASSFDSSSNSGDFPHAYDINGDGRTDYILVICDPRKYYPSPENDYDADCKVEGVWLAKGDGSFARDTTSNLSNVDLGTYGRLPGHRNYTLIGNFSGNGGTEFLIFDRWPSGVGAKLYSNSPSAGTDQLLSVLDGLSGRSTLTYSPAANTTRVVAGHAATGRMVDTAPSGFVVKSLSVPSGLPGQSLVTEFAYAGMKSDRDGRGSLGYAEVRREVRSPAGNPITTVTRLSQDYPFTGSVLSTEVFLAPIEGVSGTPLTSNALIYCDAANTAAAKAAAIGSMTNCAGVSSLFKIPYAAYATAQGKDLDGTQLPTQSTTTTVNSLGYVTQTLVQITGGGETFTTTQDTAYAADDTSCTSSSDCRWWLARPSRVVVSKTAPSAIRSTVAGSAPLATATQGTLSSATPTLSAISFGTVAVGSSSTQQATLTNPTSTAISVSSIGAGSVTGTDFSYIGSTCGTALAAGANCSVSVRFSPTAAQARSGALAVTAGTSSLSAALSGQGGTLAASISGVAFGDKVVGSSSTQQAVVTNTGTMVVSLTPPGASSVSGTDFAFSSTTCGASLAPGATCVVVVAFSPSAAVSRTGTLAVSSNAGALSSNLTGAGVAFPLTLSAVAFGDVQVGTPSVQPATLSNTGGTAVTLTTPSASSISGTDFSFSSTTCGASLAAGASCTVAVQFSPSAQASRTGTIGLSSALGSVQSALSGRGVVQQATLGSLSFGSVAVGSDATLNATLTNASSTSLNITTPGSAAVAGSDFSFQSTTCGATLAAGASCVVGIKFSPTSAVTRNGTLTVQTAGGPVQAILNGVGYVPSLVLDHVGPSATGWVMPAYSSSTLAVYYRNNGAGPVTINSTAATGTSGPFKYTDVAIPASCWTGRSLAAGASCWVLVGWNGVPGAASATLTMNSTAGTLNTSLSAVQKTLDVSVSNNGASTSSTADLVVSITNNTVGRFQFDSTALTLTGAGGAGSWAVQSSTCPAMLAANGGNCSVTVRYTAGAGGPGSVTASPNGTFEFQDMLDGYSFPSGQFRNGPTAVAPVALSASSSSQLTLSYAQGSIAFGSVQTGQTATSGVVTLTNNSGVTASGLSLTPPAGYSLSGSSCGSSLAAGASCTFSVAFTPAQAQSYTGSLTASSSNGVTSASLGVSGSGVAPSLVLDHVNPSASGWVMPAYSISGLGVYLKNTGVGPVTLNNISVAGSYGPWTTMESSIDASCFVGKVLGAGKSCWILVLWNGVPGTTSATLTVNSTAGTLNTSLSAVQKTLDVSVSNNGASTSSTADLVVSITNNTVGRFQFDSTALTLSGTSGSGSWAVQSSTCPAMLAANGGSCSVTVRYTAGAGGPGSVTASPNGTFEWQDMLDGLGFPSGLFRGGPTSVAPVALSASSIGATPQLSALTPSPFSAGTNMTPYANSGGHVTFKNTGNATVTITGNPTVTNGAGMYVTPGDPVWCYSGASLSAGATCIVYVFFPDGSPGNHSTLLTVPSNGTNPSVTVNAHYSNGLVIDPVDYGSVLIGTGFTKTITVRNTAAYTARSVSLDALSPPFMLFTNGCVGTLAPGASCTIDVTFDPQYQAFFTGQLKVRATYNQVYNQNYESTQPGGSTVYIGGLFGTGDTPRYPDSARPGSGGQTKLANPETSLPLIQRTPYSIKGALQ